MVELDICLGICRKWNRNQERDFGCFALCLKSTLEFAMWRTSALACSWVVRYTTDAMQARPRKGDHWSRSLLSFPLRSRAAYSLVVCATGFAPRVPQPGPLEL
ncbi:hypothetical protein LY78DRAFT_186460 [Colletotrichum sublineola]|nr:hypothetical protein LY78DRAFT_186460 [Colletotrichum sublineola]